MTDKLIVLNRSAKLTHILIRIFSVTLLLASQYLNYNYLGNSTLILLAMITSWFGIPYLFNKAVRSGISGKHAGMFTDSKSAKEFVDECFK